MFISNALKLAYFNSKKISRGDTPGSLLKTERGRRKERRGGKERGGVASWLAGGWTPLCAKTLSRMNLSGYVKHVTIFSRMPTTV